MRWLESCLFVISAAMNIAVMALCLPCYASDGKTSLLAPVQINERGTGEARSIIQAKGKLTLEVYLRAVDANFPGLISAEDQRRRFRQVLCKNCQAASSVRFSSFLLIPST